jgi:hypothetical protein
MKILFWGILLIAFSACNVAEQKVVSESTGSQNAQNEIFDLDDSDNFIRFAYPSTTHDEDDTEDARVLVYRRGDISSPQTVYIQLLESSSSADTGDIVAIEDTLGNNISIPAGTDPIISFTIPADSKQMELFFDINNDSVYEANEFIQLKILDSANEYSIEDYSDFQLTIRDDETPPYYYIANGISDNSTINEGGAGSDFDLSFVVGPTPTKYPITFTLSYSGTAKASEFECDYPLAGSPLPTSVTVPAGSTLVTVNIEALSDTKAEVNENLKVNIESINTTPLAELDLSPALFSFYNNLQDHTINVTETSGLSTDVNFDPYCASMNENSAASACTVTVTLDDDIDEDTYVDLDFSASTATLGQDFTTNKTRLLFYKDQGASQQQSFILTPINDNFYDGAENINIQLQPSSRLTAGGTNTATIAINDDEAAVTVGFASGAFSVLEGSSINIPVILNNASQEDITVNYTVSTVPADSATIGVDHNLAASGTFLISAGTTQSNTTFITYNDAAFDDSEVIYLTLTTIASGTASVSGSNTLAITIRESGSLPVLTFSENAQTVQEGNTLTVTLNTDKVSEAGKDYTILLSEVSTDSSDYTYALGVFNRTFPASSTTDSFTININTDSTDEPTESFVMTIITADDMAFGQYTSQYINVLDDTAVPTLDVAASNASVAEGATEQFTLTLDNASGFDINVPYTLSGTSTSGDDYILASGSVLIPKGTASVDIDVSPYDDDLYEGTETIIITLGTNTSKYTLGTASDTMNITDAQPIPTVSFGGVAGGGFEAYFDQIEGDIVNIPIELDIASSNDIDVTMLVEDKWGASDDCDAKCASVFNYDSIHKNLAQVSVSGMDNTSGAQVGTSSTYRVTFTGIPTVGTIDVDYNDSTGTLDSTINITPAMITGADIDAVCDNLVSVINNNANGFVRMELYAFHKADTDYVDIKPRPRFLDTDIDQYIAGDEITITIPAGSTQGVISFNALDDDLYELTTDERFRLTINNATGGTTINLAKDEAGVNIEDVHEMPRAQFVQKTFARTEPQTDATAVISIPIYLSNYSEIESDYLVRITNDPSGSVNIADENDFVVYDTLSKTNLEASSIYGRVPGTIITGLSPTITELPTFIYNETETAFDLFDDGDSDATISSIQRKDSVTNPNNIVTQITFDAAGNGGDFDLLGLSGTITVDIDTLCGGCTDTATATALATWLNTNYPDDIIATAVLGTLELQPAYLPSLKYSSDIVKTFRIKIPAGQNMDYIPLEIINDLVYEGSEKLTITLSQITGADPPVNTANDAFGNPNNVADLTINDDETISTLEIASDTGNSESEGTGLPITNTQAGTYTYNNVTYTVTISPMYQHSDINFEIRFTGDMTYFDSGSSPTPFEFMLNDYTLDTSLVDSNYTVNDNSGTLEFTYPAGYTNGSIQFQARVYQDYRYEQDESLIATVQNNDAGDIGSNSSASTTFTDDDSSYPLVKATAVSLPISEDEWEEETETVGLIITDANDFFFGEHITDISANFDYEITGTYRHTTGTSTLITGSASLNSSNSYSYSVSIDQGEVGDFRQFTSLSYSIQNLTDANYDTGQSYYNPVPEYDIIFNFDNIPDVVVKSSHGTMYGHTCSLHRGLLNCFGNNGRGQLGKELPAIQWGAGSGEDITDQLEAANLGTNSYGNPLYVKDFTLGQNYTCVVFTNNKVKCFGEGRYLGLGINNTSQDIGDDVGEMGDALQFVDLGLSDSDIISSIHSSRLTTCVVVSSTGTARCWGSNNNGLLGIELSDTMEIIGDETSEMGSSLTDVMFPGVIELFKMGLYHACAKNTLGQVGCWGNATYGKLGGGVLNSGIIGDTPGDPGEMGNNLNFINVSSFGEVDEIDLGAHHTCIRTDDRTYFNIRCYGNNKSGQLGLGRVTYNAGINNDVTHYDENDIDIFDDSNRIDQLGAGLNAYFDELIYSSGQRTSFFIGGSPIDYLPYVFSSGTYYFDADTSKNGSSGGLLRNQHVQTYFSADSMKAGVTFTCATYGRYYINGSTPVNSPNIRCWGSNSASDYPLYETATHPSWSDRGLLNNVGHNKYFVGTHLGVTLPPFKTTYNGGAHLDVANILSSNPGGACAFSPSSAMCDFAKTMSEVGKDSQFSTTYSGNYDLYKYYEDPDNDTTNDFHYEFGWLNNFEGTSLNLNFELNHAYSMVNIDFSSYQDVDISDGMYNTCALPRLSAPTHASGSNNEFQCWGENIRGQAAVSNALTCSGTTTKVGAHDSCGNAASGQMKSLDYSF